MSSPTRNRSTILFDLITRKTILPRFFVDSWTTIKLIYLLGSFYSTLFFFFHSIANKIKTEATIFFFVYKNANINSFFSKRLK